MKKHTPFKILVFVSLFVGSVMAATISRVTTFSDGDVLTAAQLNAEFDNVVDGVNSINNDNIVTNAAIAPSKISAAIKGSAISRNSSTGALSVNPDDSTIEISADAIRVKDDGITGAKLAPAVAGLGIVQDGSGNLDVNPDGSTLEINTDALRVKDGGITKPKLAALGQQISAGSGFFSTTSGTPVDVTNLSVTITTTGRPVFLGLISEATPSLGSFITASTSQATVQIVRGATVISQNVNGTSASPIGSIMTIDTPGAGTYTYKIRLNTFTGNAQINEARLIAYEL